jgi:hypothetical protein
MKIIGMSVSCHNSKILLVGGEGYKEGEKAGEHVEIL